MGYLRLKDLQYKGKKVIVRMDLDVPFDRQGNIADDSRLEKALPTLHYLLEHDAKVIIMGHVGRPKGQVVDSLRTDKVALRIKRLLDNRYDVKKLHDCIGVEHEIGSMKPGCVAVLENLRFHEEEKSNDEGFARKLAGLADIYVNESFATAHRDNASVTGVPKFIPGVMGLRFEQELRMLSMIHSPDRPFVVIMGGLKISDKIKVIETLLEKADVLLICGAMANTFLKAQGKGIGKSVYDEASVDFARSLLSKNKLVEYPNFDQKIYKVILPVDLICAEKLEEDSKTRLCTPNNVPKDYYIVDIGPRTIALYEEIILNSQMVFWNGPAGFFEVEDFAFGTNELAKFMAQTTARTIVGGGDTAEAIYRMKLERNFTHVSTGGGASLKFIEDSQLPAVKALEDSCSSNKEAFRDLRIADSLHPELLH